MSAPRIPPPPPRRPGLAGFLDLDPMSPLLAILPLIAAVAASRTWTVGALVMSVTLPLLVVFQPRRGAVSALAILAFASALTLGFAPSVVGGRATTAPFLERLPMFTPVQWDGALDFSTRVGAILALVLAAGLLSGPEATIRAFVVHLRMPNRIAEAGIASFGFIEVLRREQRSIIEAHILRGSALDAPLLGPAVR